MRGLRITQHKDLHTFIYYVGFCIIHELRVLTKAMTNPVLSITYISRLVKYSFALIINLLHRGFHDSNIPGLTTARAAQPTRRSLPSKTQSVYCVHENRRMEFLLK